MTIHATDAATFRRMLERLRRAGASHAAGRAGESRHGLLVEAAAWLRRRGAAQDGPEAGDLRTAARAAGKPDREIDAAIRSAWAKPSLQPDADAGRRRGSKPASKPPRPNPFAAPPQEAPAGGPSKPPPSEPRPNPFEAPPQPEPEPRADAGGRDAGAPDAEAGPDTGPAGGAAADAMRDFFRRLKEEAEAAEEAGGAAAAAAAAWKPAETLAEARQTAKMPPALLSLGGLGGALLVDGDVLILAGVGGVAKSTFVASLAVEAAAVPDLSGFEDLGEDGGRFGGAETDGGGPGRYPLMGGLFDWRAGAGCRVLLAQFEDPAAVTVRMLDRAARAADEADRAEVEARGGTCRGVFDAAGGGVVVLPMADAGPLFGPLSDEDAEANALADGGSGAPDAAAAEPAAAAGASGSRAFYNARPGRLAGWRRLAREIDHHAPKLVVIDPATCAYVGSQEAAAVSEFVTALRKLARDKGCGVVLVAHSTKAARSKNEAGGGADLMDPGAVSGTAAWFDRARAVALLAFDGRTGAEPGARVLAIQKANLGPARLFRNLELTRAGAGAGGERRRAITRMAAAPGTEWADVDTFESGEPATAGKKDRERDAAEVLRLSKDGIPKETIAERLQRPLEFVESVLETGG